MFAERSLHAPLIFFRTFFSFNKNKTKEKKKINKLNENWDFRLGFHLNARALRIKWFVFDLYLFDQSRSTFVPGWKVFFFFLSFKFHAIKFRQFHFALLTFYYWTKGRKKFHFKWPPSSHQNIHFAFLLLLRMKKKNFIRKYLQYHVQYHWKEKYFLLLRTVIHGSSRKNWRFLSIIMRKAINQTYNIRWGVGSVRLLLWFSIQMKIHTHTHTRVHWTEHWIAYPFLILYQFTVYWKSVYNVAVSSVPVETINFFFCFFYGTLIYLQYLYKIPNKRKEKIVLEIELGLFKLHNSSEVDINCLNEARVL